MLPADRVPVDSGIIRHLPITLAIWHVNSPTNKRITLAADGKRLDKTILRVCPGRVELVQTSDIRATIDALTCNDFITAGVPRGSGTFNHRYDNDAEYSRTQECVGFKAQPGLLPIDCDAPVDGPELFDTICEAGRLIGLDIATAAGCWYHSSGSGIVGPDGHDFGIRGCHLLLAIDDASKVPDVLDGLFDALWLLGKGTVKISRAGSLLLRSPVDKALRGPAQPLFAGPPDLGDGLSRPGFARHSIGGISLLDTSALRPLSDDHAALVRINKDIARASRRDEAAAIAAAFRENGIDSAVARGLSVSLATSMYTGLSKGRLLPGFLLTRNDGSTVDVKDILADPSSFHNEYFYDPLEPEEGPSRARLNGTVLYSFLHGGGEFHLEMTADMVQAAIDALPRKKSGDTVLERAIRKAGAAILATTSDPAVVGQIASRTGLGVAHWKDLPRLPEGDAGRLALTNDSTHHQIADAFMADRATAAVSTEGRLWSPVKGLWKGIDGAAVAQELADSRYDGIARCCKASDYRGIADLILGKKKIDGFFDKEIPGVVHGGRLWTVDAQGIHVRDLRPEDRQRVEFPHAPTQGAHPLWDKVLTDSWSHRPWQILILQEVLGLTLIDLVHILEKAAVWLGPSRAGKGTMTNPIYGMFPRSARTSISPTEWGDPERLHQMAGSRFNAAGEISEEKPIAMENFKAVIGRDAVTARQLYCGSYSTHIKALHLFSCNQWPVLKNAGQDFYVRWLIFKFDKSRIGEEDPTLKDRIMEEIPQIMYWALEGAVRYFQQGGLTPNPELPELIQEWREESDSVIAYFKNSGRIVEDPGANLSLMGFYNDYTNWCRSVGLVPVSYKKISRRLNQLDILTGKISITVIKNYRLNNDYIDPTHDGQTVISAALARMEELDIPPIHNDALQFALEAIEKHLPNLPSK